MTYFAGFILLAGAMLLGAPGSSFADAADSHAVPRARLVREIAAMAAQDRAETGRPSISPRVMEALARRADAAALARVQGAAVPQALG